MTEHHHLADGAEASSGPLFSPSNPRNGRLQGKSRPAISPPGSHGVCIYQSCWLPAAGAHIQPHNSPSAVALAAGGGRDGPGRGVTGKAPLSRAGLAARGRLPLTMCSHQVHPFAVGAPGAARCPTGDLHETPLISSCGTSSGWSADAHLGAISPPFSSRMQTLTLVYTRSPGPSFSVTRGAATATAKSPSASHGQARTAEAAQDLWEAGQLPQQTGGVRVLRAVSGAQSSPI